jgi:hypothetical protein
MNSRLAKITIGLALCVLWTTDGLYASPPPTTLHYQRYRHRDGTLTIYSCGQETYVRETLPNEWYASWDLATLQAGAVIIRSGVYWRINRTVLNSGFPNNNCYKGTNGVYTWYRETPRYELARDGVEWGQENWHPGSGTFNTDDATNSTSQLHADRITLPNQRPDYFMPHRYNRTVQNRTYTCTGPYYEKIWCATVNYGGSIDPNVECNQTDDLQRYDPTYRRE